MSGTTSILCSTYYQLNTNSPNYLYNNQPAQSASTHQYRKENQSQYQSQWH